MTVPNFEIQAAANGARLANFILKEHRLFINSTFCWTDCTAVLKWINTAYKRQKNFIANILNIILETTTANQWNYVPTESNQVDDGTRGYKAEEMTANSRWIKGHNFLLLPPEEWPKKPLSYTSDVTCDQHSTFAASSWTIDQQTIEETIDPQRFSNWDLLLGALSYCYMSADVIQNPNVDKTLNFQHLTKTFSYMIRSSQRRQFGDDITALKKSNELSTKSRLRSLQPYTDNSSILRARGRLSEAPYLLTSKNPIGLDAEDWTIILLIKQHSYRKQTQ